MNGHVEYIDVCIDRTVSEGCISRFHASYLSSCEVLITHRQSARHNPQRPSHQEYSSGLVGSRNCFSLLYIRVLVDYKAIWLQFLAS